MTDPTPSPRPVRTGPEPQPPVRCPAIEHPDLPDDSPLEYVGLGPGLPRRVKRDLRRRLRPARPAHPDLRAIGRVHR